VIQGHAGGHVAELTGGHVMTSPTASVEASPFGLRFENLEIVRKDKNNEIPEVGGVGELNADGGFGLALRALLQADALNREAA